MRHACQLLVLLVLAIPVTASAWEESEDHWAFRNPARREPPARDSLKHAARVRNPIDRFVLRRLETAADRSSFIVWQPYF